MGALAARADQADWPRQTDHDRGVLTLKAAPGRIVSTSPSLTGLLLAIGAPLEASAATTVGRLTDESGFFRQWAEIAHARGVRTLYPNLDFDMEALLIAGPDLVVGSSTGADSLLPYLAEIEAQGLPTLVLDYSKTSWQSLARILGRATGHEAGADTAIAEFDRRAAQAAARLGPSGRAVSIVGYDIAGTYSIGRSESPQADVLRALGLTVTPLPEALRGAVTRVSNMDFISRETLSAAIAEDTVILLGADDSDVAAFMADPLLANLPAVQKGQVYPMGLSSFRVDYYSALEMIATLETALTA
ncbi:Fe2+-enterobactin ABC transporter substrate-binding protein [Falsirhodobacter algicola]|uniref:Fe2+-enterobactin ABC transporter substrate-binding protein n=2 Tax=Falsirhodobacter algicola TaxID=2692330 RepID=A0A8J8MUG2_9RHOB|nr:Fe2+-enterobactin ABC transporter substrate-binding protein [Falsirhodobacter algicola]